ncbi:MAG TPA: cyclic nucleotide-binding domain-containing protein [Thermoanaerobaculia bacterium]|nr:cyclic nucleotide-binding domain-containing protein [Thermoanaerobaculia bacterium]
MERSEASPASLLPYFRACGLFDSLPADVLEQLEAGLLRVRLGPGEVLFRQGDPSDAMEVVITGRLGVEVVHSNGAVTGVAELGPGEPVGELQLVSGGDRTATVVARTETELARLPKALFEEVAHRCPQVITQVAGLVHRRMRRYRLEAVLPKYFGTVDAELLGEIERHVRWVHLGRGELLFRQGDREATLYILMSGRLRVEVEEADGSSRTIGEVIPGESVGEMAVFTREERSASVRAIRDSKLVALTAESVEHLAARQPRAIMAVARIVVERLRREIRSDEAVRRTGNLAFVGLRPDFPLADFVDRFAGALGSSGPVALLDSRGVDRALGTPGISQLPEHDPNNLRLEVWLEEQEVLHDFVLYRADASATNWSLRCLRQADRVIFVADAAGDPELSPLERELGGFASAAGSERMLLLVHDDDTRLPRGTERWLDRRPVETWHHLRRTSDGDLGRLARHVRGEAVGLALGGGGAKGYAHLGVLRAFRDAGIEVDAIAGTSMGSIVAGVYAMGEDLGPLVERIRALFDRYRPFKEYTLPLYSLIGSRRLDRMLREFFGDTRVEDLWIPFFCVSTDLTNAQRTVHTRGPLWKAIRCSISLPGILLPMIEGENLLVDGGLVNNLPADILKELYGGKVVAVDVSPPKAVTIDRSHTRFPSPWRMAIGRLWPGAARSTLPGIAQVLLRTTALSSIHTLERVRRECDWYLKVPVERFGLLAFEEIESIVEVGYQHARSELAAEGARRLGAGNRS